MGTDWNHGATFASIPKLPHGLNGIVLTSDAYVGENCTIIHQVTFGNDYHSARNASTIGNIVTFFPGAKLLGHITIGDNDVIGANAVVVKDVPSNSLVVAKESRFITRNS